MLHAAFGEAAPEIEAAETGEHAACGVWTLSRRSSLLRRCTLSAFQNSVTALVVLSCSIALLPNGRSDRGPSTSLRILTRGNCALQCPPARSRLPVSPLGIITATRLHLRGSVSRCPSAWPSASHPRVHTRPLSGRARPGIGALGVPGAGDFQGPLSALWARPRAGPGPPCAA